MRRHRYDAYMHSERLFTGRILSFENAGSVFVRCVGKYNRLCDRIFLYYSRFFPRLYAVEYDQRSCPRRRQSFVVDVLDACGRDHKYHPRPCFHICL